jgi:protein-disulfide isomerase
MAACRLGAVGGIHHIHDDEGVNLSAGGRSHGLGLVRFLFVVLARVGATLHRSLHGFLPSRSLVRGILAIPCRPVQVVCDKKNQRVPTMKRLIAALLLSATPMLTGPAMAFDISAMSDAEKQDFGAAVREYLMANPQVLIESINELENQQAQQTAQNDVDLVADNHDAIFDDGHSWVGGNPDGDLTMVEFMDYRCGVCRQFNEEVKNAVAADGNIRLIIKEFPILGQDSEASSRFAIAAKQLGGDEAYAKAHDILMELRTPASEDALRKVAGQIDLDADQVIARMTSDEVTDVLNKNRSLGNTMAVQGTPTFIIGETMLRGVPRAGVAATIEQIRDTM